MRITKPALAAFFLGIAPLRMCEIIAQEPADPRSNAIDPAALTTAPAFGNSGPAQIRSGVTLNEHMPPKPKTSDEKNEDWQPRFRVQLFWQLPNPATMHNDAPGLDSLTAPEIGSHVMSSDVQASEDDILLLSDSVRLDAQKSHSGELLYSLSCKGRMILNVNGLRISGRDCSLANGQLTIRNAEVVTQQHLTLHADRITMTVSLAGITVHSADSQSPSLDEGLKPIPDTIGESEASQGVPEKTNAADSPSPTSDQVLPPKEN